MKKNIVQDVIPPKRSIRDIELPSRSRRLQVEVEPPDTDILEIESTDYIEDKKPPKKGSSRKMSAPTTQFTYDYDKPKHSSRKGLYTAIFLFVLAALFGISALFKSAEIRVTPRLETKFLDETFTAKRDAMSVNLSFQIVTNTKDIEKTVEATALQKVEKKAQGKVVIYNNYSTKPQRLDIDTRLETKEGLIFKTANALVVPGNYTKDGKTVAGSVEVTAIAAAPGDKFNVGLKDFTIFGFKGDPRYTKIYARSKTSMLGGFSGMQKVVTLEVLNEVDKELEESLRNLLAKDITSQIPENFILYEGGLSHNFEPTVESNGPSGNVILKKKATTYAIIFDKATLSRAILAKISPDITDSAVKINNLGTLLFSYKPEAAFDQKTSTTVSFTLTGKPNIVWIFDENKLKSELLGLSKKNAREIIAKYDVIKEAIIKIWPFWIQTLPNNSKKVKLINTLAQ